MPHRQLPNSTPTIAYTLVTARGTYKNTPAADRAITAEQWAQLDDTDPNSLLNRFLKEKAAVNLDFANQAPLTKAIASAAARLTMGVSHFHQVLDLGIARGTFAAGARSFYDRDINAATIPDLSSYASVLAAANKVVTGEAARAAAELAGVPHFDDGTTFDSGAHFDVGTHIPMALPSAAEIATALTGFVNLRNQVQIAETATDKEQEALMKIYPDAQALAVDICDTVEFYYRKDSDASSRRVKCARWGVVYVFDANEPQPPTPAPAPAPQPPAPTP